MRLSLESQGALPSNYDEQIKYLSCRQNPSQLAIQPPLKNSNAIVFGGVSCTASQLRSSILSPTTPKPFSWFISLPILSYRPLIIAHLNQHWACTPIHPCQLYPHKITTPSLSLPGKSWLAFIGALLVFPRILLRFPHPLRRCYQKYN